MVTDRQDYSAERRELEAVGAQLFLHQAPQLSRNPVFGFRSTFGDREIQVRTELVFEEEKRKR